MMRGPSRILAAGAVLLGTMGPAAAATYRWIDDDGVVHLTNNQSRFEAQRRRELPPVPEPPPKSSGSRERSEVSRSRESAELRRTESVTTEVMRLSGLSVQVDLLARVILGEFDRLRSSGSPPAAGAVPLVAQTFSADALRSNMREALARSLDPERTRALLAWLRAPLSLRIVSLESALPTVDRQAALTDYVNLLPSRPPAPARLALIQRLERAGDVTQVSAVVLAKVDYALRAILPPGWIVRLQAPVSLDAESEPEPDLVVVHGRPGDYLQAHPGRPVLAIEVAESSLEFDREQKGSLYARAGVEDYWIVNLVDRVLEVHRGPWPDTSAPYGWRYRSVTRLARPSVIVPLAFASSQIAVADLLP